LIVIVISISVYMIAYTNRECSGSRDLFNFWETTDYISETIQDDYSFSYNSNIRVGKGRHWGHLPLAPDTLELGVVQHNYRLVIMED